MTKSGLFFVVAVAALGAIAPLHEAGAAAIGQSCSTPGATALSNDQRSGVMCLSNGPGSFVWQQITAPLPAPVANSQGQPVAHFEDNGALVWNAHAPSPLSQTVPNAAADGKSFNWTGFYVGGNFGVSYDSYSFDDIDDYFGSIFSNQGPVDRNSVGLQPGITVGYNWQFARAVLGIEADANANFDIGQSRGQCKNMSCGSNNDYGIDHGGISDYATLRGKAGFLATDNALAYFTAGGIYARASQTIKDFDPFNQTIRDEWRSSVDRFGFVAGVGGELALTDHMSVTGELLHAFLLPDTAHDFNANGYRMSFSDQMDILRVGLNWHFQ